MSGQIRQARETSVEVYWALQDIREDGYRFLKVGATTEFIKCP